MKFVATSGTRVETVEVTEEGGRYRVHVGERVWEIDARLTSPGIYSLLVDGVSYVATVAEHDGSCLVDVGGETHAVRVEEHTRYVIRTRGRSEEHTSELQSRLHLVCRLLLEKKKQQKIQQLC